MTYLSDIARPDGELSGQTGTPNQAKFLDIWWRICSTSGLAKWANAVASAVLNLPVPKLDANWNATKSNTSALVEIGALPQNFKALSDKVDALAAKIASPTLSDAQLQSLAAQIAAAIPADATPQQIADAVVLATKNQFNK